MTLMYRVGMPRNLTAAEADANLLDLDNRLVAVAAAQAALDARLAALEAVPAARAIGGTGPPGALA